MTCTQSLEASDPSGPMQNGTTYLHTHVQCMHSIIQVFIRNIGLIVFAMCATCQSCHLQDQSSESLYTGS